MGAPEENSHARNFPARPSQKNPRAWDKKKWPAREKKWPAREKKWPAFSAKQLVLVFASTTLAHQLFSLHPPPSTFHPPPSTKSGATKKPLTRVRDYARAG